jgi:hypothetical protein
VKVGQELNLELASDTNPLAVLAADIFWIRNAAAYEAILEIEIVARHSVQNLLERLFSTLRAVQGIDSVPLDF